MPVSPVAPVAPVAPAGPGTATTVGAGVTTTGLSQAVDSKAGIARNRIEALIGICLSTVERRRYARAAGSSVRYRADGVNAGWLRHREAAEQLVDEVRAAGRADAVASQHPREAGPRMRHRAGA